MPSNFRPVDAPDVLATFAGFSEMMDRMHALPVCVTPSVEFAHRKSARWTGDEDDKMLELYAQGLSYRAIGEGLGRSYEGVRQRLYFLGYGKP
jgi:hypothetical protein